MEGRGKQARKGGPDGQAEGTQKEQRKEVPPDLAHIEALINSLSNVAAVPTAAEQLAPLLEQMPPSAMSHLLDALKALLSTLPDAQATAAEKADLARAHTAVLRLLCTAREKACIPLKQVPSLLTVVLALERHAIDVPRRVPGGQLWEPCRTELEALAAYAGAMLQSGSTATTAERSALIGAAGAVAAALGHGATDEDRALLKGMAEAIGTPLVFTSLVPYALVSGVVMQRLLPGAQLPELAVAALPADEATTQASMHRGMTRAIVCAGLAKGYLKADELLSPEVALRVAAHLKKPGLQAIIRIEAVTQGDEEGQRAEQAVGLGVLLPNAIRQLLELLGATFVPKPDRRGQPRFEYSPGVPLYEIMSGKESFASFEELSDTLAGLNLEGPYAPVKDATNAKTNREVARALATVAKEPLNSLQATRTNEFPRIQRAMGKEGLAPQGGDVGDICESLALANASVGLISQVIFPKDATTWDAANISSQLSIVAVLGPGILQQVTDLFNLVEACAATNTPMPFKETHERAQALRCTCAELLLSVQLLEDFKMGIVSSAAAADGALASMGTWLQTKSAGMKDLVDAAGKSKHDIGLWVTKLCMDGDLAALREPFQKVVCPAAQRCLTLSMYSARKADALSGSQSTVAEWLGLDGTITTQGARLLVERLPQGTGDQVLDLKYVVLGRKYQIAAAVIEAAITDLPQLHIVFKEMEQFVVLRNRALMAARIHCAASAATALADLAAHPPPPNTAKAKLAHKLLGSAFDEFLPRLNALLELCGGSGVVSEAAAAAVDVCASARSRLVDGLSSYRRHDEVLRSHAQLMRTIQKGPRPDAAESEDDEAEEGSPGPAATPAPPDEPVQAAQLPVELRSTNTAVADAAAARVMERVAAGEPEALEGLAAKAQRPAAQPSTLNPAATPFQPRATPAPPRVA